MRFNGLDLNLLVAFNVLMEERSVRRAAERLRLSQPATSSALARLREFFRDPILVQEGKRMFSTPYAENLLPHVRECLRNASSLIAMTSGFDPTTSHRVFRVATSDFLTTALLAPVACALTQVAPQVRLELFLPDDLTLTKLERGEIDLLLAPSEFNREVCVSELLSKEKHCIVGCASNPIFQEKMTDEVFLGAGHVSVAFGASRHLSFADHHLSLMGKDRRIEVVAASFAAIPWFIIDTPRLAALPARLARVMQRFMPIASAPFPFEFPLMDENLHFHRSRRGDEGLAWLIAILRGQLGREA